MWMMSLRTPSAQLAAAQIRVSADATAFAQRHWRMMVNVAAIYTQPDDAATHEAYPSRFRLFVDDWLDLKSSNSPTRYAITTTGGRDVPIRAIHVDVA